MPAAPWAAGICFRPAEEGEKPMRQFPKGGIIGKTVNAVRMISRLQIPLYAANAGFFIILSLFPALVLLLSLVRYTGFQVESLIEVLRGFIPDVLMDTAEDLVISTYESSSSAVVGLSAVTALWSSSRGIYGLLTGLNAIYDVSENRGYVYTRTISVVYTFAFFLVLLLTLVLQVFGNSILAFLSASTNPVLIFLAEMVDLRFFLLLVLQTGFFTLMFMVLPNQRNRFMDSLPGALLASIGWLVFSDVYSIYVENFAGLTVVYGSVYAIALSMLWLYCCLSIVFYGGALNYYLKKREK